MAEAAVAADSGRQRAGYFRAGDGTPLFGVYHAPAAPARVPVLMAPAFFEERKSAYAALAALARRLCAAGHPVLRFDYRGSGESGGEPARRRWADLAADLVAAREHLARWSGAEAVALLGLRLGAALALLEARSQRARAVAALAPVVFGPAELRLWRLRSKVRTELTPGASAPHPDEAPDRAVDLDGFPVSAEFLEDVRGVNLLAAPPALDCPALIVQVSHREGPAPESAKLLAALGPLAQLTCVRLEPFWDRVDDVDARPVAEKVQAFLAGLGA